MIDLSVKQDGNPVENYNHQMIIKKRIIFFLLIFTSITLEYQNSAYYLPYSSAQCTFYYKSSNSNFTFERCVFGRQMQTERFNGNWSQCVTKCCQMDIQLNQSRNSIRMCQDNLFWTHIVKDILFPLEIVGGITLFLSIVAFLAFFCWYRNNKPKKTNPPPKRKLKESQLPRSSCNLVEQNIDWSTLNEEPSILTQTCSICLQTQGNIELKCGHSFHSSCISNWLKIKQQCPVCRSCDVSNLTVYCKKCYIAKNQQSAIKFFRISQDC